MTAHRNTPEYTAWINMRNRCAKPKAKGYAQYGARGITVCERWQKSFLAFLADVGSRPTPDHQLDRINNDGNYEPGNCRWITRLEQASNRRDNVMITYDGVTASLSEWERRVGFPRRTVWQRINVLGWSAERAITTPVRHRRSPI